MRPLLWLSFLVSVAAACDQESTPSTQPSAAPSASEGLTVGASVVAATGRVSFRQGTVAAIDGDEITIEYGKEDPKSGKKPRQTLSRANLWLAGQALAVEAGEHLACQLSDEAWVPCKVEAREGELIRIVDAFGNERRLAATQLVRPSEETRKAITTYLEREARHRTFDRAFDKAGEPRRPEGWLPDEGESVVVHFVGTSWYGGEVLEVQRDRGKARIRYDGKVFPDRDVPLDDIAPRPEAAAEVRVGQFVLVRPEQPTMRWEPHEVVRVEGGSAVVVSRDHEERTVARERLLPVGS